MQELTQTVQRFFALPLLQKPAETYLETAKNIDELCSHIIGYEQKGYDRQAIHEQILPLRTIHSRSPFFKRAQEWPDGYQGDYQTIEQLLNRDNQSPPHTLEYFCEEYALNGPIAQQHRNKLHYQADLILDSLSKSPEQETKILSIASNSCWDLRSIQHLVADTRATFYLNDHDAEALEHARQKLEKISTKCQFIPGNFIRAMKRLRQDAPFHLITTGGLCDYLNDRQLTYLIENAYAHLLAPGGTLYLTNVGKRNQYRPWMEYLVNWQLIERDEEDMIRIIQMAGCPLNQLKIQREACGLTLLIELRKPLAEAVTR